MPFNTRRRVDDIKRAVLQVSETHGLSIETYKCSAHGLNNCQKPCPDNAYECPVEPLSEGDLVFKLHGSSMVVKRRESDDTSKDEVFDPAKHFSSPVTRQPVTDTVEIERPSRAELAQAFEIHDEQQSLHSSTNPSVKTDEQLIHEALVEFQLYVPKNFHRMEQLRLVVFQIMKCFYKYQFRQGLGLETGHGITRSFIRSHITPNSRKYVDLALINAEKIGLIRRFQVADKFFYAIAQRTAQIVEQKLTEDLL